MPERHVLCGGTKRTAGASALRLALSVWAQNITLTLEDISKKMVRNVPDLLVDLIEIATYVYCADQATSRTGLARLEWGRTSAEAFDSSSR
ncbi:MAG: hypothetical protein ACRD37_03910 [Candidatus Acidiferrales bacterium]